MYVKNLHPTLTEGHSAVAGRRANVVALFGSILSKVYHRLTAPSDVIRTARSSRQSGEHL